MSNISDQRFLSLHVENLKNLKNLEIDFLDKEYYIKVEIDLQPLIEV